MHLRRHIAEYTLLLTVLRSTDYAAEVRWYPLTARLLRSKKSDQKVTTDTRKTHVAGVEKLPVILMHIKKLIEMFPAIIFLLFLKRHSVDLFLDAIQIFRALLVILAKKVSQLLI